VSAAEQQDSHIAFVGLGAMGRHMASNVARSGRTVTGHDVQSDALSGTSVPGLSQAPTLEGALNGVTALVLSLPDTPHVEEVLLAPGGAAERLPSGSLVIDMSTISPVATQRMAARLTERGIDLVDAPVSGGVKGAQEGTLTIMCGGSESAFQRARPILDAMGKTVTHFGPSGAGQTVKLCNQVVCALHIQAAAEAFALARAAGVDLADVRQALMGGSAASWILDNLGPLMVEKDDRPNFRIELQAKDLRLVSELAASLKVPLPGASLVTNLYYSALANDEGGLGNQSLYRVYDRLTGQTE
jgi:2-hydroxy-3-oxopropionate reductase